MNARHRRPNPLQQDHRHSGHRHFSQLIIRANEGGDVFRASAGRLILAVSVAAAGCSREIAVEVVNTSGQRWRVSVTDSAFGDVYWDDSSESAKSLRWPVPDHARGDKVFLIISPPVNTEASGVSPATPTRTWGDSIVLDRAWTVQVHKPRFVDGTPAWKETRAQYEAEVARWFAGAIEKAALSPEMLVSARANRLNDPSLRSPEAPHYVPNVELRGSQSWSTGPANSFLLLVLGVATVLWAVIFAVSRWVLKQSRNLVRTSRILVSAVTSIAIVLGLQNSGDDPLPSYLLGKIAGTVLVLLLPVAFAIGVERLRRRKAIYRTATVK